MGGRPEGDDCVMRGGGRPKRDVTLEEKKVREIGEKRGEGGEKGLKIGKKYLFSN